MNALLNWMNSAAIPNLLGNPVSWIELIGFLTGAACVFGVARQKVWNWPVGILNNLAFLILFLGAGLYGDTALQVVFGVVGAYGWFNWARGNKDTAGRDDLRIRGASRAEASWGVIAALAATGVVGAVLAAETNSTVPWPDAFVLAASLVATYGQAKKILQHWYVWIVVDLVSIPLYLTKDLTLTAILYSRLSCSLRLRALRLEAHPPDGSDGKRHARELLQRSRYGRCLRCSRTPWSSESFTRPTPVIPI
ncbi:nicotinamide riboside transporter PnuC [Pseudarthrobacter sp. So.54]